VAAPEVGLAAACSDMQRHHSRFEAAAAVAAHTHTGRAALPPPPPAAAHRRRLELAAINPVLFPFEDKGGIHDVLNDRAVIFLNQLVCRANNVDTKHRFIVILPAGGKYHICLGLHRQSVRCEAKPQSSCKKNMQLAFSFNQNIARVVHDSRATVCQYLSARRDAGLHRAPRPHAANPHLGKACVR
jgi:hypothetical protein